MTDPSQIREVQLMTASAPAYVSRRQLDAMRKAQDQIVGPGSYDQKSSLKNQIMSSKSTASAISIKPITTQQQLVSSQREKNLLASTS